MKILILGHHDTHGVMSAYCYLQKVLLEEPDAVITTIVSFPDTKPENIPELIEKEGDKYDRIVLLDIPVDIRNPERFISALNRVGDKVEYYDHHATTKQYFDKLKVRKKMLFDSAFDLTFNFEDRSFFFSAIGAIADRDITVVKRGFYSNIVKKIADGFDVLVREDAQRLFARLCEDPTGTVEEALSASERIPRAKILREDKGVALCDVLPENWGFKSMEKAIEERGLVYAVGMTEKAVLVIRHWTKEEFPTVREALKGFLDGRKHFGHDNAIVIPVNDENDAKIVRDEVFRTLASRS